MQRRRILQVMTSTAATGAPAFAAAQEPAA
jgi:hypothetical protein